MTSLCPIILFDSFSPRVHILMQDSSVYRDAFAPYATSIFILQMMMKNFIFYSFSTFVNDYAKSHGPAYMLKVFGIVTLCGFTTCLPMCKFEIIKIKRSRPLINIDVFGKVNRAWVHRVHSKLLA